MAAQYPHGRDPGNSLGRHYSDFQLIGLSGYAKPLSRRPSVSENLQNPVPIGEVRLVAQVVHSAGYNLLSFTRAFAVVKCQSALACLPLRTASQAWTSFFNPC
jgi:hypothetical protein